MSPKVSIIVPVYNAEKTLAACLGNLVNQTLTDIELILVNDCSTDKSLSILLDCEQAFPEKVLLINKTFNSGPGGARNAALPYASGEYIGFVDSDDLVDITMFEKLYNCAVSGNYDMVDCGYYYEKTDSLLLMTGDECIGDLNNEKRAILISNGGYLWTRIFHRELFKGFHFRENIILEDLEALMFLFMRSKRLGTVKETLYKYCNTPESASSLSNPVRYHRAITNAMHAVSNTLSPFPDYSNVQSAVEYSLVQLYHRGITNALFNEHNLSNMQRTIYLKELQNLRFQYVKLPLSSNSFIQNKFSKEDLKLIHDIDIME